MWSQRVQQDWATFTFSLSSVRMLAGTVVTAGLPAHLTPCPSTCLSWLYRRLYSGSDTISPQDGRWSCVVRDGGLEDCNLCNINSHDCVLSVGRLGLWFAVLSRPLVSHWNSLWLPHPSLKAGCCRVTVVTELFLPSMLSILIHKSGGVRCMMLIIVRFPWRMESFLDM